MEVLQWSDARYSTANLSMQRAFLSRVSNRPPRLTLLFFPFAQDDTLIPIVIHPTPTALVPYPQPLQTNQATFTHSCLPRTLLVTTGDGSVKLLDYPSLNTVHVLHAHTSACFCLELAPTGRYLAVGGSDALISLWDTTEWVCRRTLAGMVGAVKQVSFSWDGSYVVGGSDEGNGLEIVRFVSSSSPFLMPKSSFYEFQYKTPYPLPPFLLLSRSHFNIYISIYIPSKLTPHPQNPKPDPTNKISNLGPARQAHVESGEHVFTVPTTAPAPCIAWHPSRYWLAYSGDPMGLKIVGAAGGEL